MTRYCVAVFCCFLLSCGEREGVVVEGLGVVDLIGLLAHRDGQTRTRAHLELRRYLVEETGHADYSERLTRFYKFAPHACKEGNESQTLSVLELFAAQEDVSSVLVEQCLRSPSARVRAKALEVAHFSDNRLDAVLLAFEPDAETADAYEFALRKLRAAATEEAGER